MAEMLFVQYMKENFPQVVFQVDSAAIEHWEVGNSIDPRAFKALNKYGVPYNGHRARQIRREDFQKFDLIIGMTYSHYRSLRNLEPSFEVGNFENTHEKIYMYNQFQESDDGKIITVPAASELDIDDPWYGDMTDFEKCFAELQAGLSNIVEFAMP